MYKLVETREIVNTCGGATTGGALYSLLLLSVPVGNLFCGGVGGLVVGAGPAEVWDTLPRLPYWVFWAMPGPYWLLLLDLQNKAVWTPY